MKKRPSAKETRQKKEDIDTSIRIDPRKTELLKYRGFHTKGHRLDDLFYTERELSSSIYRRDNMPWRDVLKLPYEEMKERLFSKDSIEMQESIWVFDQSFLSTFAGRELFYDVNAASLDPFVARYVRSINRCGMNTCYSCDGWHESPR